MPRRASSLFLLATPQVVHVVGPYIEGLNAPKSFQSISTVATNPYTLGQVTTASLNAPKSFQSISTLFPTQLFAEAVY
jgi:hypothetical protein